MLTREQNSKQVSRAVAQDGAVTAKTRRTGRVVIRQCGDPVPLVYIGPFRSGCTARWSGKYQCEISVPTSPSGYVVQIQNVAFRNPTKPTRLRVLQDENSSEYSLTPCT
jgi:hypothetical protein